MAALQTVLKCQAKDMTEFNTHVEEARLGMMLSKAQLAALYELVRDRLPAVVIVALRSAKGATQIILLHADTVETFSLDHRAKLK